jgi:hypothetical protein
MIKYKQTNKNNKKKSLSLKPFSFSFKTLKLYILYLNKNRALKKVCPKTPLCLFYISLSLSLI